MNATEKAIKLEAAFQTALMGVTDLRKALFRCGLPDPGSARDAFFGIANFRQGMIGNHEINSVGRMDGVTQKRDVIACTACGGTGSIEYDEELPAPPDALEPRMKVVSEDCAYCDGSGSIDVVLCLVCGGYIGSTSRPPHGMPECACSDDDLEAWAIEHDALAAWLSEKPAQKEEVAS